MLIRTRRKMRTRTDGTLSDGEEITHPDMQKFIMEQIQQFQQDQEERFKLMQEESDRKLAETLARMESSEGTA